MGITGHRHFWRDCKDRRGRFGQKCDDCKIELTYEEIVEVDGWDEDANREARLSRAARMKMRRQGLT
jgi:hypothetical protein